MLLWFQLLPAYQPVFAREEGREETEWDPPWLASSKTAAVYPGAVAEPV